MTQGLSQHFCGGWAIGFCHAVSSNEPLALGTIHYTAEHKQSYRHTHTQSGKRLISEGEFPKLDDNRSTRTSAKWGISAETIGQSRD